MMQNKLQGDQLKNWTQKILCPDIVTLYYLMENQIIHALNILHFPLCMTVLTNIPNLTKWTCELNFCSECPGVFVTDAEFNGDKDLDLPLVIIHHYKNISSGSLHKQVSPEHYKTRPLCMNLDNLEDKTRKSLVLKVTLKSATNIKLVTVKNREARIKNSRNNTPADVNRKHKWN